MAARWYATGRIYFDYVLAFDTGAVVPDSIVEAYDLIGAGAVSIIKPASSSGEFVLHPHVDSPTGGGSGGDLSADELDSLTADLVNTPTSQTRTSVLAAANAALASATIGSTGLDANTVVRRDGSGWIAARQVYLDYQAPEVYAATRRDYVDEATRPVREATPYAQWLQIVRRDGTGHAEFSKVTLHDTADLAGHHAARRDYVASEIDLPSLTLLFENGLV